MSRRLWGPALIGALLLGMSAMPTSALAQTGSAARQPSRSVALTNSQFASQVLARINLRRHKIGCGALRSNPALATSARRHTSMMVRDNDLSHQLGGEASLAPRIVSAGYKPWRILAENLAWGPPTPNDIFLMWLHSPQHRANMQNCSLRDGGVGVTYAGGHAWVTLDLGRH